MLAELVPQQELGKVYGLLAILDASLPFLGKEIFAFILFLQNSFSSPLGQPSLGRNSRYNAWSFLSCQCRGKQHPAEGFHYL